MEDHLKMCRLEEVACEFSGVGCEDRFPRENEEEHIHQKSQSHLSVTAATLVTVNQQLKHRVQDQQDKIENLEKKALDQDQKIQDQEQKMQDQNQKIQEQDQKIQDQDQKIQDQDQDQYIQDHDNKLKDHEKKLQDQEKKFMDQEKKLQDQEKKIQDQEKMLYEQKQKMDQKIQEQDQNVQDLQKTLQEKEQLSQKLEMRILQLETQNILSKRFTVENFSKRKTRISTPGMYTHIPGYKFHIVILPTGASRCTNETMLTYVYMEHGEYDDQLVWPAKAKFTLELVNQKNGDNIKAEVLQEWKKPSQAEFLEVFDCLIVNQCHAFMKLCNIDDFLHNDSLHFRLTVEVMVDLKV